jgi:hypothetical protein
MYVNKDIADKYQEFFNFMSKEHDMTLTMSEMDEIVSESQKIVKKLAIPIVRHSCLKCSNYVPEGCEGVATHREPYCLKTGYYQLRTFPFKNTKCKHYNCA